jgi:glycerol-3-phosphate acyltransferase PlsY
MPWIEQIQSANWNQASCISIFSYLLGCFTTGYYLVRFARGQDVRELGSGNVGAKNVGRILGVPGFIFTLLGDFAKGAIAVGTVRHFIKDERFVALAFVAVVVGHIWPIQLRFRGGKGIATSLGALVVYDYHLAIAFIVLFLLAFGFIRKTVLPGLIAFSCLPLVGMYQAENHVRVTTLSTLAVVVLLTHRKNLMEEFLHLLEHRAVHTKSNQPKL